MKLPISFFINAYCCVAAFSHGLHSHSERHFEIEPSKDVEIKDIGGVIAVKRQFPLSQSLCAKYYVLEESLCRVELVSSQVSHHDFTFPVKPVTLSNGDEVDFDSDEKSYTITYFGEYQTKEEQLSQVGKAVAKLTTKEIAVHLYRPADPTPPQLIPFKETKLGTVVGVKRKVFIRYSDCAAKYLDSGCWVNIVSETVPDHPGPAAGGDISKVYEFSNNEKVTISLENFNNDYLIYYQGPETEKDKILGKINTAIEKLKGSEKELTLECDMFTLKKGIDKPKPNYSDTLVSNATFFEVAIPLTYEICKNNLDTGNKSCRGDFEVNLSTKFDHPGGEEWIKENIGVEGILDVYGTYVSGHPYWKLFYDQKTGTTLSPLEFLEKGFNHLKDIGKTKIRGYGFGAS